MSICVIIALLVSTAAAAAALGVRARIAAEWQRVFAPQPPFLGFAHSLAPTATSLHFGLYLPRFGPWIRLISASIRLISASIRLIAASIRLTSSPHTYIHTYIQC